MANYRAISATSNSLAGLIRDYYPRAEFGSGLEVSLYQARDFESPMADGFSVYLYRVSVNGTVRNSTPRRAADGRRYRPSFPIDLQYMITPWAADAGRAHRMLGWLMRTMEDISVLSAGHLNHYLHETDTFAANEGLELVCDPLSLSDYLTLWDRVRRLPTSASYTVRVVLLDSEILLGEAPLAQTRDFDIGEVVE